MKSLELNEDQHGKLTEMITKLFPEYQRVTIGLVYSRSDMIAENYINSTRSYEGPWIEFLLINIFNKVYSKLSWGSPGKYIKRSQMLRYMDARHFEGDLSDYTHPIDLIYRDFELILQMEKSVDIKASL